MTQVERSEKGGFIQIPRRVLYRRDLGTGPRLLWAAMKDFAWNDGETWVSQTRLASDLGVSDRSVRTWAKRLAEKGVIAIKPRSGRTHVYELLEDVRRGPEKRSGVPGKDFRSTPEERSDDLYTRDIDTTPRVGARDSQLPQGLCPFDHEKSWDHANGWAHECVACSSWVPYYKQEYPDAWTALVDDGFSDRVIYAVMEELDDATGIESEKHWAKWKAQQMKREVEALLREEIEEIEEMEAT